MKPVVIELRLAVSVGHMTLSAWKILKFRLKYSFGRSRFQVYRLHMRTVKISTSYGLHALDYIIPSMYIHGRS